MSALDKSLDEIIGASKAVRRNKTTPKKVSKQINKNRGKRVVGPARLPKKSNPALVPAMLRTALSTRVNVEGLPRDINQEAVKVCSIFCLR